MDERRCDTQPQRDRGTRRNEAFELSTQNSQTIEALHSESLTACGSWTCVAGRNRRRHIDVDISVDNALAVLDHD